MSVPAGGGIPQFRQGGTANVGEKLDGYGFEKVQYVHIQFRFGGEGGLLMGVVVRRVYSLKCKVIFGDDLRKPACY